jgi:hypothetical protein
MVQRVATVAFEGIEARAVDVQVQVAPGLPAFNLLSSINLAARVSTLYSNFNDLKYALKTAPARLFICPDVNAGTAQR